MVEATQTGELAENEVLFKVDRFALTANNISYASAGYYLADAEKTKAVMRPSATLNAALASA